MWRRWFTPSFRFRLRGKAYAELRRILAKPLLGVAHMGRHTTIVRPRRIDGRESISVGDDGLILKDCWLQALSYYAGSTYQPRITIGQHFYAGMRR